MTRESLAKDILIALIPEWMAPKLEVPEDACCTRTIAYTAVTLADALLEALGTTEPPASWLSKEMQTPAKGFPAIKDHRVDFDGVKVSLYRREPGDGVNPATASLGSVDAWVPELWSTVKWKGSRLACVVESVCAGPTRSWTLIKERKGARRTYVVKDVSELVPYELEADEE